MKFVVGIDEAGRGPVLGPMVYGIAAYPEEKHEELRGAGADDSKKLTHASRLRILERLKALPDFHYNTISISAKEISQKMLLPTKISLNDIAFYAARDVLVDFSYKFEISHAYIDLISPASQYEAFIRYKLPKLCMTVAAKADATYPVTGAASIAAKITRDSQIDENQGCGYPGDSYTIDWLAQHVNVVYGFPDNVRVSWKTAENIIEQKCKKCCFFSELEQPDSQLLKDAKNGKLGVFIE